MKRVLVYLTINNYKLKTKGFINNNILSFNDIDKNKTNIIYDFNDNLLIRDNNDITIKLYFNKKDNNIEYILKKEDVKFFQKIDHLELINNVNKVIINYRIDKTDFHVNLSYKEES